MSIVYQMTSTASSGKTAGVSKSSGTSATGGVAGSFDQTLAQSMTDGAANTSTSESSESLSSNPLVFTFASLEEGEQTSLVELLNSLFVDLDSLDEATESDPSLAADLQVIIQQLYALLNGSGEAEAATDEGATAQAQVDTGSSLSINLQEHPAAARFVLQDVIAQLATMLSEPNSAVAKNTTEVKHLLATLQDRLAESGIQLNTNKSWNELKAVVSAFESLNNSTEQTTQAQNASLSKLDSAQVAASTVVDNDSSDANANVSSNGNDGQEVDQARVITAGELSLRTSGTTVGKPAEPVMQASQFAKEMTQFVVSKLDIVHQKGFSEATISLRPEHLGKLDVQITIQNGQMVARFLTEHSMAKDMLEQQMAQLRSSLQTQGIQVEKIEVTQNTSIGSQMYQDGGRQSGSNSQQQRRSRERDEQTEDALKTASLQEELRNWRSEHEEDNELQRDSFTAEA